MSQEFIGRSALALSVAVHGWAFTGAPIEHRVRALPAPPVIVEFTVSPPPPEPLPPAAPELEPQQETRRMLAKVASERPVSAAKPAVAPPVELTGTTLLSELGATWSAPRGSGNSRRGAFRAGVSYTVPDSPSPQKVVTRSVAQVPAIAVLPLAQLSKKPVPPALGGALKRNYPREARRQGKSGEAKVRARVEASGSIALAKVAFETSKGFGKACRKTLLDSQWSAPLNRKGDPVATWVSYRCKFRIDD